MKKYPKYKPSSVEWIREIPEHWEVSRMTKHIESIVDYRGKTPEKCDNGVFLITARNIKNGKIDYSLSQEYIKPEDYLEVMRRGKPKIGDVLFTTEAPLGEVANIDKEEIALAQRVIKFRCKIEELDNFFLKYWIMSNDFQNDLQTYATGSTALGIKSSKLNYLLLIRPPFPEQQSIANFLDKKTSQIETLIQKKTEMIKLLKEEKSAVINKAVTKGINPDIKMKDSGVEWIGEIPEHWEVRKLKRIINDKLKYGANEVGEGEIPNFPRYIRITDFGDDGKLRSDTFKSLSPEVAEDYLLENGDILFARSGATVGKTFQFKNYKGKACFAGYLIKASPNESIIKSDYLYFFTKTNSYENWKNSIFNQATIQNIGADKYSILDVVIPPLIEQQAIVTHIETETSRIDTTTAKIEKEIELIKEYKTALISEAVTGKIDVRGLP